MVRKVVSKLTDCELLFEDGGQTGLPQGTVVLASRNVRN